MQITLDIKKRETFAIIIILLLIALGAAVYAITYVNPTNKVGHDASEITYGTIDGDLEISGDLIIASGGGADLLSPPSGISNGSVFSIICNINSTLCNGGPQ